MVLAEQAEAAMDLSVTDGIRAAANLVEGLAAQAGASQIDGKSALGQAAKILNDWADERMQELRRVHD